MNSVTLIGRLTRDPDVRYGSQSQMAVARFSIAVNRPMSKNGEEQTDFPNIVCFGKTAELVERYLNKGRLVGIQGQLRTGSYVNREGVKVYTTEVYADRVEFLDKGDRQGESRSNYGGGYNQERRDYGGNGGYAQPAPEDQTPEGFTKLTDDDIPF